MSSLVECFSIIRDPHQESKIDHELIDILVLCVLGVICGAEGGLGLKIATFAAI